MKYALSLSLLLLSTLIYASTTHDNCSSQFDVCYRAVESDTSVELYLINKLSSPVTIEATFNTTNLDTAFELSEASTLTPNETKNIASYDYNNHPDGWFYSWDYYYYLGALNATHNDSYLYQLPYPENESFVVSQSFNGEFSHLDGGNQYAIDFAMPIGTDIIAARAGKVIKTVDEFRFAGTSDHYYNKANYVLIEHKDGSIGGYYHLDYQAVYVNVGDTVITGEKIAESGNTGFSTGPHLHFAITTPINGKEIKSFPFIFASTVGPISDPAKGVYYQSLNTLVLQEEVSPDEKKNQEEISQTSTPNASSANSSSSGASFNWVFITLLFGLVRGRTATFFPRYIIKKTNKHSG